MKEQKGSLYSVWSALALLGLLVGACAPAAAPAPPPKPAPTVAPAAPAPPVAPAAPAPTPKPAPTVAPAAPAPITKPAVGQPRYGGVMVFGQSTDPVSFDVHREITGVSAYVTMPHYNGLLWYEDKDPLLRTVLPDLAEKWESPDGKVFTFKLRQGVKFSDGVEFTAEDAKYSLDRIARPPKGLPSPRQEDLSAITSTEVVDKYTLKVTLKYPSAAFIKLLAGPWILMLPKHILEKEGQDALRLKIVGTGPFLLKEYIRGVSFESVKNPNYWVKGLPYLDGFRFYIIKDYGARLAALRSGQIMAITEVPGVTPSEAKILKAELGDKIVLESQPIQGVMGLMFNMTWKPFDDLRVRQAVSLALNREAASTVVMEGAATISGPMLITGQWGLPKEELVKYPDFGPDMKARMAKAKELMAEAGYTKDKSLGTTILARSDLPMFSKMAEFGAGVLPEIGIKAKVELRESGAFYDSMAKKAFEMAPFTGAMAIDDPDSVFGTWWTTTATRNYGSYSNPELDRLYVKQSQTLDPVERRKIVDEMQRIVLKDTPMAMVGYMSPYRAVLAKVKGFNFPRQSSSMHNKRLQGVWLAE